MNIFMAVLPYVTDDFDSIYPTTADHFCWRFAWLLREGTCGDTQRWLQALQLFRYTYTKQQLSLNLRRLAVFLQNSSGLPNIPSIIWFV